MLISAVDWNSTLEGRRDAQNWRAPPPLRESLSLRVNLALIELRS